MQITIEDKADPARIFKGEVGEWSIIKQILAKQPAFIMILNHGFFSYRVVWITFFSASRTLIEGAPL